MTILLHIDKKNPSTLPPAMLAPHSYMYPIGGSEKKWERSSTLLICTFLHSQDYYAEMDKKSSYTLVFSAIKSKGSEIGSDLLPFKLGLSKICP